MPRRSWAHEPERESRHKRGYGRQHQKLREQLLYQEPLCRLCMQKNPPRRTPATIADHIVSIAKGGAVHDLANMQPVCASCHNDKSLRDQGKRVKRRIGLDGWPCDD
jgi:5-methylcytosine-specific restriction protein A